MANTTTSINFPRVVATCTDFVHERGAVTFMDLADMLGVNSGLPIHGDKTIGRGKPGRTPNAEPALSPRPVSLPIPRQSSPARLRRQQPPRHRC